MVTARALPAKEIFRMLLIFSSLHIHLRQVCEHASQEVFRFNPYLVFLMSQSVNGVAGATAQLTKDQRPFREIRRQLIILGRQTYFLLLKLFPLKQSTGFFLLSEAIAWTSIFPYIYAMVQSFSSPESGDQNAAVFAGIMVSVFTFGEFLMTPQWAKISDLIGRKYTLLVGSIGAILSAILFGFSRSLPMAIASRTCAGLLNPNLGVVQTYVGELVMKEYQGISEFFHCHVAPISNCVGLFYSKGIFYRTLSSRLWVRVRSFGMS